MIINLKNQTEEKMKNCTKNFVSSINNLRTDRASPDLLKNLYVEYYGKKTILSNISNIVVEDSRTLRINTFDHKVNKQVEKSIINSNLGLNPISVGNIIRVPIPQLTEDRRNKLIKILHVKSEKSKVCVRIVRRESNDLVKNLLKNKDISKNEEKKLQNEIQLLTNFYIKEINNLTKEKEKQLNSF
ncbi:ribosome recycling factor [Buchnera aphidicola]|uniref:ribosome recycling factor n=1 Tax=Buchnera aphidicola TaxID=9 RepID=UPI002238A7EA|nr:ribosome recycling factor [Buchnera aphidicola]MCW5197752.1 ribosome recycling factor [Buchnera aphidicola (Chaitophorus viminalis)]